jgi:hypothetical protein
MLVWEGKMCIFVINQLEMKKITLFIVLFVASFQLASAQKISQARMDSDRNATRQHIKDGHVEFFFNRNINKEEVRRSAEYYTTYFTVNFDEGSGRVSISFADESQMARRVLGRFLLSNNIEEIMIGTELLSVTDFMDQFLN